MYIETLDRKRITTKWLSDFKIEKESYVQRWLVNYYQFRLMTTRQQSVLGGVSKSMLVNSVNREIENK